MRWSIGGGGVILNNYTDLYLVHHAVSKAIATSGTNFVDYIYICRDNHLHETLPSLVRKPYDKMATEMDRNQRQVEEEIDCLFCKRSKVLPPPRLSIAAGKRPTGGSKKNTPTKAAR